MIGETNPPEAVKLELTPEEAQLFVLFRKFQDTFTNMSNSGVFDIKGSSATLHFDEQGKLRRVEIYKGFKF